MSLINFTLSTYITTSAEVSIGLGYDLWKRSEDAFSVILRPVSATPFK